jgi:MFS family permease
MSKSRVVVTQNTDSETSTGAGEEVALPAFWRNRDFILLQAGRFFSNTGTEASTIAYPLLVLALTHSPARAGLVTFARIIPTALFALPAGILVDRWNRRHLMIAADMIGLAAMGTLAAIVLGGVEWFWAIPVVAFVEGSASVLFSLAGAGALKALVARRQLPAAVATQRGRAAAVRLASPPLGGALFAISRGLPFLFDSISYALSSVTLAVIRTPFQQSRKLEPTPIRVQLAEGFRFLWSEPFIRSTTFLYAFGTITMPATALIVIVVGRREGLSSSEIGALMGLIGAALLSGAFTSHLFRRAFSMRTIILLELWAALGVAAFLIWPSVWALVLGVLPQAVIMPVTDSVVVGYRVAITPEHLLGRAESVRSNIANLMQPLGPLAAGLLLSSVSPRATVAVLVSWSALLLVCAIFSQAVRNAPRLEDLETAPSR